MKTKLILTVLLVLASAGAWADGVECVLPWGADEPWQMKYVRQEPDTDGNGKAWTQPGFDDSQWETLTGPLATSDFPEEGDTWFAPHIESVNYPADKAGEEVTLSVVLNADKPVTAFQFDLYLPDGMEMTFDKDGYENILLSTARTTKRRHTITSQQMSDGAWRVICYSDRNSTFDGDEGEVCTICVKTSAEMANNGFPITLKNVTTTYISDGGELDQVERNQLISYINFFTPDYPQQGDVNNDGEVDLSDAIMVTYYSLHVVPANFNEAAADMNGDGDIDLSDAIVIIYKSLGVK